MPNPEPARIALKLPPTLITLCDPKYKNLSQSDFQEACEVVFQSLTISIDEAKYLEESTRLQSQSKLWFDYWAGRLTASKFAAVSKASLSPPPASLVKEIIGSKPVSLDGVPAIDWGKKTNPLREKNTCKKQRRYMLH